MKMETGLTIQQAAELSGLSEHTLRYYERIGLLKGVGRASNGHRRYGERDINRITFLNKLRMTGMGIQQMKAFNDLFLQGDHTIPQRRLLLQQHQLEVQARIEELQHNLDVISYKIELYREKEADSVQAEIPSKV
jgi:DNA-binding transcriptional MerR regulator